MRFRLFTLPSAAAALAALGFVALTSAGTHPALADDGEAAGPPVTSAPLPKRAPSPSCSCPEASGKPQRPKFAGFPGSLDEGDEIAALLSLQHGLNNAADGSKYVWHRNNGRLSGIIHPVDSFRNGDGAICRHIVVMLTTGLVTKKTEGTACRGEAGRWMLQG